jgi:hypothetical protein
MINPLSIESTHGEPSSTETKESRLKTIWIPLGLLLVAALSLIVGTAPVWVTVVIVAYIAVVAVAVLIPPIRESWRWLRRRKLANVLVKDYYPQLQQMVNILLPELEQSHSETVYQLWHSIGAWTEAQGHVKPDPSHIRTLYSWLFSINKRLASDRKSEFADITSELGEFVLQYNHFCEQAHRELDLFATRGNLQPQKLRSLRQEWNQVRDKHNQTVKSWEDLAKNINKAAGEQICFDHYSLLKTIE